MSGWHCLKSFEIYVAWKTHKTYSHTHKVGTGGKCKRMASAIISVASAQEVRQTQSDASISAARAQEVCNLAKALCRLRTNRSAIVLSVIDSSIVLRAQEVCKLAKALCRLRTNRSAIVLSVIDSSIVLILRTNSVKNTESNTFCSTKVYSPSWLRPFKLMTLTCTGDMTSSFQ